jgi:hypothetical protein
MFFVIFHFIYLFEREFFVFQIRIDLRSHVIKTGDIMNNQAKTNPLIPKNVYRVRFLLKLNDVFTG